MANYRRGRINDETQKALSTIIREVKDPRVAAAFISITGADVTPDLKYAKIYYSVLGSDPDADREVARGLKSSTGYIRHRLSQEIDLRITPELTFIPDRSIANGAHIASLLESVGHGAGSGAKEKENAAENDDEGADGGETASGDDGN